MAKSKHENNNIELIYTYMNTDSLVFIHQDFAQY